MDDRIQPVQPQRPVRRKKTRPAGLERVAAEFHAAAGRPAVTSPTPPLENTLPESAALNQTLLDALPCAALLLKADTHQIVASNRMACQIGAVVGTTCYAGL
jgi:hypothetical protein